VNAPPAGWLPSFDSCLPIRNHAPWTLVVGAITALAIEAFFVDPNNAQSILTNGDVTPNNAPALAAAMSDGTAQISTVTHPLQASFASPGGNRPGRRCSSSGE